jgi:cation transport regulator ChaC
MGQLLYFAYGSNLDTQQMRARCASARIDARAVVRNHALVFGGFSARWGGPVATLVPARGAEVEGLLYVLQPADLRSLDRHEGHPFIYARVKRFVTDEHGRRRRVEVYVQPQISVGPWGPPPRYVRVLRRAYKRLGFDASRLAAASEVAP